MSATGRGTERRKDDFYATPGWCVDLLLAMKDLFQPFLWGKFLDPCCGDGAILARLPPTCHAYGIEKDLSRVSSANKSASCATIIAGDFLTDVQHVNWYDHVITNPPYSLAQEFVEQSLRAVKRHGTVAMLLRLGFIASSKRKAFWANNPADRILVLPKRPCFTGDGRSDACEYAWFVWREHDGPTIIERINE